MKKLRPLDVLVFPITYHCDARCIMCTIPQRAGPNLSDEFFRSFFENRNIATIKSLNLTGGEPTLRDDLPKMVSMIAEACPRLQEILVNSNGLNTARVFESAQEILKILPSGIKCWFFISLDSMDETECVSTRGVGRAGARAKRTIHKLLELKKAHRNFEVALSCTITRVNYDALAPVFAFARANNIFVDFIYATVNTVFINSKPLEDKFVLDGNQRAVVADTLRGFLLANDVKINRGSLEGTIRHLTGGRAHTFCIFAEGRGALLEPTGIVRTCGMMEEGKLGDINCESPDEIFDRPMPDIAEFCAKCANNNYVNWAPEAQLIAATDTLTSIRNLRRKGN